MTIKHTHEVVANDVKLGVNMTKQVLISGEEAPRFAMRRFVIQPGGSFPNHTNLVEHEQYILNGKAKFGIGDEVFEVQKGDAVYIPVGVPHWYKNDGDEPFDFLCLIPTTFADVTTIVE